VSIARAVEALLIMATDPVPAADLAAQLGVPEREVVAELEQLARFYRETERGFELRRVAGGWRLATAPDLAEVLEAAVVAETGGLLSHAAIVAREYGIPAVLGVLEATTRLHDGQVVTVDGSAGRVRTEETPRSVAR